MMDKLYQRAYRKIKDAGRILAVTHARPDGDALSSLSVMMELFISLKKPFTAYTQDEPPPQYSFLPYMELVKSRYSELDFSSHDLIVALDCGSLSRTTIADDILAKTKSQFVIEFDHHPKVDDYAEIEIRDPKASSTAEILYHFLKINLIPINKNFATGILTGILTDTGNFLYPSTTDKTINIASEMQRKGASFPRILENTWRNKSLKAMKFWGKAMERLTVNPRYNLAFSLLTYDEIASSGTSEEEFEGIAGFLSNLSGVNGLMLLREEEPGRIKGSLRTSHPDMDISRLATLLGGGGHAKAAGFVVKGRLKHDGNRWRIVE